MTTTLIFASACLGSENEKYCSIKNAEVIKYGTCKALQDEVLFTECYKEDSIKIQHSEVVRYSTNDQCKKTPAKPTGQSK